MGIDIFSFAAYNNIKLKENAPNDPAVRRGHSVYAQEKSMDLLQKCAVAFDRLTGYQYRFTLGRKGKLKEIVLGFGETTVQYDRLTPKTSKKEEG